MAYSCEFARLLDILAVADTQRYLYLKESHRAVVNGLLSVGLKLHVLQSASDAFAPLARELRLPSPASLIGNNVYKMTGASFCLVLPPVGSATATIELVHLLERFIGREIFNSEDIQPQICSPGRLGLDNTALLGTSFLLGSRILRTYSVEQLKTTVANDSRYLRAPRYVIYDGYNNMGEFDPSFAYWDRDEAGGLIIRETFPFIRGRSDVLTGTAHPEDIENVNLIATLLIHAQCGGFWRDLGLAFIAAMRSLFESHQLKPVLKAPWVSVGGGRDSLEDEEAFSEAITDLSAYVIEDGRRRLKDHHAPPGILADMQEILRTCRIELQLAAQECAGPA